LDRTESIVKKSANRISAFHFHSIRSWGNRRISPSGGYRERHPRGFGSSQHQHQFISLDCVSSDASNCASLDFSWRSFFELRHCRPSCRLRGSLNTLRLMAPFVRIRELRRPVTRRHRWSDLHGKPKYVA
jgi:hypothetical protein